MQRILINIIILVLSLFIIYKFYRMGTKKSLQTRNVFQSISNRYSEEQRKINKRDRTSRRLKKLYSYTSTLGFLNHTDKRKEQCEYITVRLNMSISQVPVSAKYFLALTDLAQLLYIAIILVLSVYRIWLLFFIALYPILSNIIINIFIGFVRDHDNTIAENFYKFYSSFYHTYKYPNNIHIPIEQVANTQYELLDEQTQRMIDLFRADCQLNENMALQNLKTRYRIPKVHRLANQLQMIVIGRELDVGSLENFRRELTNEHRKKQTRELEIKKEKGERIFMISSFILLEIIIYWSFLLIMQNK